MGESTGSAGPPVSAAPCTQGLRKGGVVHDGSSEPSSGAAPIIPILQTGTKRLFKVIVKGKSEIPCSEVPEAEPKIPVLDFEPLAHGQGWGTVGFSPSRDSQAQRFGFAENISESLPKYKVTARMQPEPWRAGLSQ